MIVSAIKTGEFEGRVPQADTAVLRIWDPIDERQPLGGQGWGDNGASPHGWDQDGDQGNGQQGQPYAPSATPYPSATPLSQ